MKNKEMPDWYKKEVSQLLEDAFYQELEKNRDGQWVAKKCWELMSEKQQLQPIETVPVDRMILAFGDMGQKGLRPVRKMFVQGFFRKKGGEFFNVMSQTFYFTPQYWTELPQAEGIRIDLKEGDISPLTEEDN